MSELEYLQNDLVLCNLAIEKLLSGKQVKELKTGSSSFARQYVFSDINLISLTEYRKDLLQQIHALSATAPVYRTNACIPNIIHKQIQQ